MRKIDVTFYVTFPVTCNLEIFSNFPLKVTFFKKVTSQRLQFSSCSVHFPARNWKVTLKGYTLMNPF